MRLLGRSSGFVPRWLASLKLGISPVKLKYQEMKVLNSLLGLQVCWSCESEGCSSSCGGGSEQAGSPEDEFPCTLFHKREEVSLLLAQLSERS